jgi:hypothetical protein
MCRLHSRGVSQPVLNQLCRWPFCAAGFFATRVLVRYRGGSCQRGLISESKLSHELSVRVTTSPFPCFLTAPADSDGNSSCRFETGSFEWSPVPAKVVHQDDFPATSSVPHKKGNKAKYAKVPVSKAPPRSAHNELEKHRCVSSRCGSLHACTVSYCIVSVWNS